MPRPVGSGVVPIKERLMSQVEFCPTTGCWLWVGTMHGNYGVLKRTGGATAYAHRVSYELFKTSIPAGFAVDHLCRVPACVNPDHLEAVTPRENMRRGASPSWTAHNTMTCQQCGSALTPKGNSGKNGCVPCNRAWQRKKYWEKKI